MTRHPKAEASARHDVHMAEPIETAPESKMLPRDYHYAVLGFRAVRV